MNQENIQAEVKALRDEHASLDCDIAEWRSWWRQLNEMGDPHFGEMGDRLARFREHLQDHFSHEESDGCLTLATKNSRGLSGQVKQLKSEHPELLDELDELIRRLHACDEEFSCWGQARQDFDAFLDRLNAHEAAEDALLERMN